MLDTLRQQHQEQRVLPAMAAHQARLLQLRAAHAAACAAVQRANDTAVRQAIRNHAAAVQQVKDDNERKVSCWLCFGQDAALQDRLQPCTLMRTATRSKPRLAYVTHSQHPSGCTQLRLWHQQFSIACGRLTVSCWCAMGVLLLLSDSHVVE